MTRDARYGNSTMGHAYNNSQLQYAIHLIVRRTLEYQYSHLTENTPCCETTIVFWLNVGTITVNLVLQLAKLLHV